MALQAVEKLGPELRLELSDLLADGRLGNVK